MHSEMERGAMDQSMAMRVAIHDGDVATLEKLFAAGAVAECNLGPPHSFESPLDIAAQSLQLEVCRFLLERGASAKGIPLRNSIPLRSAAGTMRVGKIKVTVDDRVAVCRLLLEHGADPNDAGASGVETAMHLAFRQGEGENVVPLLELMMSYGGDPSYVPDGAQHYYLTPFQKEVQVAGLLMRLQRPMFAGADKVQTWDCALKYVFFDVGVDPSQKTVRGRSLLQLCEANDVEVKDLIRQAQQLWRANKTRRVIESSIGDAPLTDCALAGERRADRRSGLSL